MAEDHEVLAALAGPAPGPEGDGAARPLALALVRRR